MTPLEMAQLHALCFETPRPWTAQEFAQQTSAPLVRSIVLDHSFALIRCIAGEAEILTLATDPNHRRRGLARTLLAAIDAHPDIHTVFLEVAANNRAARALYTSNGYRESGLRRDYYRTPEGSRIDALLLEKTLTLRP
ncbi:GNAT family N-acetyltransferase [Algirhabdus cladophorae]|uniref:GNAT family N-acetyltransferase n=1 Tax=Algirhabdus cladophorae TaxID=3377108 RepID=UPI003B84611E